MKRIAIHGSLQSGRSFLTQALAAMTGLDFIIQLPYSTVAYKYNLDSDIEKCHWPDSFVYCLGAFTQRILAEKRLDDLFISDGGVFNELSWIKCRFPHIDLIYERSMITSFEKVVVDYTLKEYDLILHVDSNSASDAIDQCLKQLYLNHRINHQLIDGSNPEEALNKMAECIQAKPVLSAKHALLKSQ